MVSGALPTAIAVSKVLLALSNVRSSVSSFHVLDNLMSISPEKKTF
jgi:hypothetical protein